MLKNRWYIKFGIMIIESVLITAMIGCSGNKEDSKKMVTEDKTVISENVENSMDKIEIKPELQQYTTNYTYEDFKNETGTEAEFIAGGIFAATIPNTDTIVHFVSSVSVTDEDYGTLRDEDCCYYIEGQLGSLINGLETNMTTTEFMEKLAVGDTLPEYSIRNGEYTHYYISGTPYISISFDSDKDGINDALLYLSFFEQSDVSTETWAWLFQGVDCSELNKELWDDGAVFENGEETTNKEEKLFDYTGYLDLNEKWSDCEYYKNRDYDADGLIDRVYRDVSWDNTNACFYTIYFGNGNVLYISEEFDSNESIAIKNADLTDNLKDEIVIFRGNLSNTELHESEKILVMRWNGRCYEQNWEEAFYEQSEAEIIYHHLNSRFLKNKLNNIGISNIVSTSGKSGKVVVGSNALKKYNSI